MGFWSLVNYLVGTNRTVEVALVTRFPSCLSLLVMKAVLFPNCRSSAVTTSLNDHTWVRVVDETFCCAQPKINLKAPPTIDSKM